MLPQVQGRLELLDWLQAQLLWQCPRPCRQQRGAIVEHERPWSFIRVVLWVLCVTGPAMAVAGWLASSGVEQLQPHLPEGLRTSASLAILWLAVASAGYLTTGRVRRQLGWTKPASGAAGERGSREG